MAPRLDLLHHGGGQGQEQGMEQPSQQPCLVEGRQGRSHKPHKTPALEYGSCGEAGCNEEPLHGKNCQRVLHAHPSEVEGRPDTCM